MKNKKKALIKPKKIVFDFSKLKKDKKPRVNDIQEEKKDFVSLEKIISSIPDNFIKRKLENIDELKKDKQIFDNNFFELNLEPPAIINNNNLRYNETKIATYSFNNSYMEVKYSLNENYDENSGKYMGKNATTKGIYPDAIIKPESQYENSKEQDKKDIKKMRKM